MIERILTHLTTGLMGVASFWWRWVHPNRERSFFILAAGATAPWNFTAIVIRLMPR